MPSGRPPVDRREVLALILLFILSGGTGAGATAVAVNLIGGSVAVGATVAGLLLGTLTVLLRIRYGPPEARFGARAGDQVPEPGSAGVLETVRAWDLAMVRNNADEIGRFMTDDWVITGADGTTQGREAFLALIRSGELTHDVMESSDVTVRVRGNAAVVTANGVSGGRFRGQPFREVERQSSLFIWQDTAWRCALTHLSRRADAGDGNPRLRSAVPAFLVSDVNATAEWYARHLGFHTAGIFPRTGPAAWASIQRDGAEIMLQGLPGYQPPRVYDQRAGGVWHAYVRLTGVGALYRTVRGQPFIRQPLRKQPYGDWEFEVEDLNGYVVVFGGDETLLSPPPEQP